MRISLLFLLACLALPLAACGDNKSDPAPTPGSTSSGKPSTDEGTGGMRTADKPAEQPAAKPTGEEGAATPEALVEKMKALAVSEDFSQLVPLVLPEQRAALTFALGIMGPSMMIAMGEAMLPMAGGGDPEKAKEAKDKFTKLKSGFEALLKKHKIDLEDDAVMGQAQSMQSDPDEAVKALNKAFGHVDHASFLKESMAFLDQMGDGKKSKSTFPTEFTEIKVDGDKATVIAKGKDKDKPLGLVKHEGRWFVDFLSMMKR
jgi:hypothetical protein